LFTHEKAGEIITLMELYNEFFPFSGEYQEFAQKLRDASRKANYTLVNRMVTKENQ